MAESANPFGLKPPLLRSVAIPDVVATQTIAAAFLTVSLVFEAAMDTTVDPVKADFDFLLDGVPFFPNGNFNTVWTAPNTLRVVSELLVGVKSTVSVRLPDYVSALRWKPGKFVDPWSYVTAPIQQI